MGNCLLNSLCGYMSVLYTPLLLTRLFLLNIEDLLAFNSMYAIVLCLFITLILYVYFSNKKKQQQINICYTCTQAHARNSGTIHPSIFSFIHSFIHNSSQAIVKLNVSANCMVFFLFSRFMPFYRHENN